MADFVDGVMSLRRSSSHEAESSLNGPIGVHRSWCWVDSHLSKIKKIRAEHGCTVNDVVLAAITAGFRALLQHRGELVQGHVVRTMVPVSVRREDEHTAADNRVSAMFAELPVGIDDPLERLAEISQQTQKMKSHHQALAGEVMISMGVLSPPSLLLQGTQLVSSREMHAFQTIATNVPGPREPLYAAGCRLRNVYLYVPITSGVRFGVAMFSYENKLTFAVTADFEHASDSKVLCSGIEKGIAELLASVLTS
jgi:WS/DGAT/MGAT family acyltransferase